MTTNLSNKLKKNVATLTGFTILTKKVKTIDIYGHLFDICQLLRNKKELDKLRSVSEVVPHSLSPSSLKAGNAFAFLMLRMSIGSRVHLPSDEPC